MAVICDNQIITEWLITGSVEDPLSGYSFRVKKNLYRPTFFSLQIVYSCKFQITEGKKSAPSFDMPFGTGLTKLKLFHVVEKIMYHSRQNELPFVNSTKNLIFNLTKILIPKRLILICCLIARLCFNRTEIDRQFL